MWPICLAASASAAALQMFGEIAPDGSGFCELRQGYGGAGVGNMCTFNFNLIYRFHTSIPVEWSATDPPPIDTDEQMRTLLNGILTWVPGGGRRRKLGEHGPALCQ